MRSLSYPKQSLKICQIINKNRIIKMASYDILGNIAIIKGEGKSKAQKLKQAKVLLKRPCVKSVLEKIGNVRGRLRTINVKHIAGEKNLIVKHRENGCVFKFNVKSCYFSPRLSNERKEIAGKVKKKDKVLVMFAGVGVYPIVIYKHAKPKEVVGIEIGKECCKYFEENLRLNKMKDRIEIIQGDVKKKMPKKKFDVVVMPRPNLKESFLREGFSACKKGTRIFYYCFGGEEGKRKMIEDIKAEAKKFMRKIKIMKVKKAGEIAPYKFRYRVEIKVV